MRRDSERAVADFGVEVGEQRLVVAGGVLLEQPDPRPLMLEDDERVVESWERTKPDRVLEAHRRIVKRPKLNRFVERLNDIGRSRTGPMLQGGLFQGFEVSDQVGKLAKGHSEMQSVGHR